MLGNNPQGSERKLSRVLSTIVAKKCVITFL